MTPSAPLPEQPTPGALRPPQFGLRTLLWGVTLICLLLAVLVSVGMAWALALLMLVLLVLAHVVGNALGTRLRDGATPTRSAESPADPLARAEPLQWEPPAATRLQVKLPPGWLQFGLALLGALLGAALGWLLVQSSYADQMNWKPLLVAMLACGILGGMAAFFTSSFVDLVHRVWREATAEEKELSRPVPAPTTHSRKTYVTSGTFLPETNSEESFPCGEPQPDSFRNGE